MSGGGGGGRCCVRALSRRRRRRQSLTLCPLCVAIQPRAGPTVHLLAPLAHRGPCLPLPLPLPPPLPPPPRKTHAARTICSLQIGGRADRGKPVARPAWSGEQAKKTEGSGQDNKRRARLSGRPAAPGKPCAGQPRLHVNYGPIASPSPLLPPSIISRLSLSGGRASAGLRTHQ